jgi:hypothetical protein
MESPPSLGSAPPGPGEAHVSLRRGFFLWGTAPKVAGSCGMVGNPQECREHSRQCFESARSAPTLATMARFEGLAHSWLRLAEDLERAKALLDRLKAPERKAG